MNFAHRYREIYLDYSCREAECQEQIMVIIIAYYKILSFPFISLNWIEPEAQTAHLHRNGRVKKSPIRRQGILFISWNGFLLCGCFSVAHNAS
ncbi:MAG: hypothetical protein DYH02_11735 [Candidatus Omnitrophica bacterium COP1]|nr:hypothetical protein [Candidatus Omnitrophica bacterium COP1]